MPQTLIDLSPTVRLMLTGLLLAVLPLAWVAWRSRGAGLGRRLHLLTVLTLFLTFDLTLFGAFTRLTDSGLGCPDWPGCYGSASPIGAQHAIREAQTAMPTGPVTFGKAWIEMIHRYLATGVGVLILTLAVASWVHWRSVRAGSRLPLSGPATVAHTPPPALVMSPWWPTVTLVWVCVQGAFGALTVTMKLFPAIVTLHLLGAMLLLGLLSVQAVRYQQAATQRAPAQAPSGVREGLWLVLGLLMLQIALGGWVSTNYAVLACQDFPTCHGRWWPEMDFATGFTLWRELGMTADGAYLPFDALTAIHFTHRLFAVVVLAALGVLAWRLWRLEGLRLHAYWLAGLSLLQLLTGVSNVVLGWPLLAAVLHTGGAAALVVVISACLAATHARAPSSATDAAKAGKATNPNRAQTA